LLIELVRQRVRAGGHDIPEAAIRRRFRHSRINLIRLQPLLAELRMYDNSATADPATGQAPKPVLVLHVQHGHIIGPPDLTWAPSWSWPIVAAAVEQSQTP
jgi:predicted ABC-type ATPase